MPETRGEQMLKILNLLLSELQGMWLNAGNEGEFLPPKYRVALDPQNCVCLLRAFFEQPRIAKSLGEEGEPGELSVVKEFLEMLLEENEIEQLASFYTFLTKEGFDPRAIIYLRALRELDALMTSC